jgi:Family of unknown function (DUF5681)
MATDEPGFATGAEPDTKNRVGYGRPPRDKRFKPGQSGNRKGRPKGAQSHKEIVRRVASETHSVIEQGEPRRRSILDLILLFLRNRAAAGDVRAFQAASDLLTRFGPQEPEEGRGCLLIPEATPEEFEQLLKDLREQHRRREEEDQRFK